MLGNLCGGLSLGDVSLQCKLYGEREKGKKIIEKKGNRWKIPSVQLLSNI